MKKPILIFAAIIFVAKGYSQLQTSGTFAGGTAYRFGETQIGGLFGANDIRGIGIGNFSTLGGGVTPQSRLHINSFFFPAVNLNTTVQNLPGNLFRTDGNETILNRWQFFTGTAATNTTEKGVLFTSPFTTTSNNVPATNHFLLQSTLGDLIFRAQGNPAGYAFPNPGPVEVMRLTKIVNPLSNGGILEGRVSITRNPSASSGNGINPNIVVDPLAMLHIGDRWTANLGGHRLWMAVGTYLHQGTDNMYVGLKTISGDRNEAIVGFGNNPSNNNANGDRMRFIFTAATGNGIASGVNGIEIAQMWSDGTNPRMSIGDLQTANVNPQNTLEILSSASSPYSATNNASGLRFTNLTSADAIVANGTNGVDNTKLLTVDENGDVVLTNVTPSTSTANNGLVVNANTVQLGGDCSNTTEVTAATLLTDRNIPLGGKNFIFSETTSGTGKVGIGAITSCTPGNLLEVKKGTTSATSGLRLTDLATATAGTYNNKVLSVNSSGDVIVTNGPTIGGGGTIANNGCSIGTGGNVVLGNIVGGTSATLLDNREIPLGTRTILFSGLSTGNNQDRIFVGSTVAGGASILGKFQTYHVGSTGVRSAVNGITDGSGATGQMIGVSGYSFNGAADSYGVKGEGKDAVTNSVGVFGTASGSGSSTSYGVWGQATSATSANNYGGFFLANNGSTNNFGLKAQTSASGSVSNHGIFSQAQFGQTVYGVRTTATGDATSLAVYGVHSLLGTTGSTFSSIAVYGKVGNIGSTYPANTNIGVYGAASTQIGYSGFFDGNLWVNGAANGAAGYPQTSDAMFKTNVDSISNALSVIKLLQPRTYYMDTTNSYGMNFNSVKHYGFIAQEVETVLPELVGSITKPAMKDSSGTTVTPAVTFKTLDYNNLIALQTKAIQEQQLTIDSMRTMMAQMAEMMNACCQSQNSRTQTPNMMDVELSDKDVIVLNQNVPNPFAEQTTITYNIPEKSGFAQIIFNDMKGQIIKVVDIKTKGKGQLNVFANDLSNGMYSYTLYIDGKLVDTKKMVKTE